MKKITVKNTLHALIALFLLPALTTIGMELEQPEKKVKYLKIKYNPASTSAFLTDKFAQMAAKAFGLLPTLGEPFISVMLENPDSSAEEINKAVQQLKDMGYEQAQIEEIKRLLSRKYLELLLPISSLLGKKNGDIIGSTLNPNEIQYLIYSDPESALTDQIKANMHQFKNHPSVRIADPNLNDANQMIFLKPFFDKGILAIHNGQLVHGPHSYYAPMPLATTEKQPSPMDQAEVNRVLQQKPSNR